MKFNRLRLENWRNFLSVDVELQRRVFLVGPNAAGKSNILDAFRFLRDMSAPMGPCQPGHTREVAMRSTCIDAYQSEETSAVTLATAIRAPR